MADNIVLSDCIVPYGWKKEQDAYERQQGRGEERDAAPSPVPPAAPRLGLSEAARLAREAGMNYGEYMAKRGIFPPPPRRKERGLMTLYAQGVVRHCEMCGKPVPKGQKKYCLECKEKAYWCRMVGRDPVKGDDKA